MAVLLIGPFFGKHILVHEQIAILLGLLVQCLKWTIARRPKAINILFRRPKVAPN